MNTPIKIISARRPTNVSLPSDLVDDAKRLGINLSQSCEEGLRKEVHKARGAEWKRENKEAIEGWNRWVRENGMPYDEYRQF